MNVELNHYLTFITIVPAICWWEEKLYLETYLFGMAVMPLLCRYVDFLLYHRKVSLAVNLPMFLISLYQKTSLHLYKWARLPLLLFTFCQQFSDDLYTCHLLFQNVAFLCYFWHKNWSNCPFLFSRKLQFMHLVFWKMNSK